MVMFWGVLIAVQNIYNNKPWTYWIKPSSIIDVWEGFKYVSDVSQLFDLSVFSKVLITCEYLSIWFLRSKKKYKFRLRALSIDNMGNLEAIVLLNQSQYFSKSINQNF